jgi:hypothetical protein
MRRGGARHEVTERVALRDDGGATLEGWALNVSRGGLRAILEGKVSLGQRFDVVIGSEDLTARPSRVVWVQEEPDGVIVGLEFTSHGGSASGAPTAPPGARAADPGGGASED